MEAGYQASLSPIRSPAGQSSGSQHTRQYKYKAAIHSNCFRFTFDNWRSFPVLTNCWYLIYRGSIWMAPIENRILRPGPRLPPSFLPLPSDDYLAASKSNLFIRRWKEKSAAFGNPNIFLISLQQLLADRWQKRKEKISPDKMCKVVWKLSQ